MQNYLRTKGQVERRRYMTYINLRVSVTHVYCSHIKFCKVDRKLQNTQRKQRNKKKQQQQHIHKEDEYHFHSF